LPDPVSGTVPPAGPPATPHSERDRKILLALAARIDPGDAGAHNNLGVLYFNKGMVENAVSQFQRALEIDPRMQVAQRNLEIAYFGSGYYHRLIAELAERLRERPDDEEARRRLARAYLHTGEHARSVRELYHLLTRNPDDIETLVDLGQVEKAAGRVDEAREWYSRALELDPGSAVLHFRLGDLYYNLGMNEEARSELRRAVELRPDFADAHHLLAFTLGDLGEDEAAVQAARRARELNPNLAKAERNLSLDRYNPERYGELVGERASRPAPVQDQYLAHYHLGVAYRQKGFYEEALRELEQALTRGEDPSLVRQAMAEIQLIRNQTQTAAALYRQLLEEDGESPKLWNELGVALHQEGEIEAAEACYRRSLEHDPGYALGWNNLAVVHLHRGEVEPGRAALVRSLELHPGLVDAGCNLGLLELRSGRYAESLRAYRETLDASPESAAAWSGVGTVLAEGKRFTEARNAFSRAIEIAPSSAEARYHLAYVLTRLGDSEGALRETQLALELNPLFAQARYRLAIELHFEYNEVLAPELEGGAHPSPDGDRQAFDFAPDDLDAVFGEMAGARPETVAPAGSSDPLALARDHMRNGMLTRALAEARRAAVDGADPIDAALLVGEIFLRQALEGEALERFEAALTRLGDRRWTERHTRAALGRARALLRLGRLELAEAAASEVVDRSAEPAEALQTLGEVLLERREWSAALDVLDRLRRETGEDPVVLRQMGAAAAEMGDHEEAERLFRRAIDLDPELVAAHLALGQLFVRLERWTAAIEVARTALEVLPGYAESLLLLATAEDGRGSTAGALDALVELLTADAYHLGALRKLGQTLARAGRYADARRALHRLVRLDPMSLEARYELAAVLRAEGRLSVALTLWRSVIESGAGTPIGQSAAAAIRESLAARGQV
jgi:cellulose synthase operon protein C